MNVKEFVTSRFWHIAGRASILNILLVLTVVSALALTSLVQGGGWLQQAKLTASDGASGDYFGASVAVDGNVAIVGARGNNKSDDEYGFDSGAAYIYTRSGDIWSQQAKLTASDVSVNDFFGWAVALDGDTAVVGAHWDDGQDDLYTDSGAAYVFTRSGGTWTQQAELTGDPTLYADFGSAVAIDGNTIVVGAQFDTGTGTAHVFTFNGTVWTQQAQLTASDGANNDYFGSSAAVDGDTAIVGAYGDDDRGSESGSVYVFVRSGDNWTQQAKLTAPDGIGSDYFGRSVALDGDTAIVASKGSGVPGNQAAYVFVRSGGVWTQQAKLTWPDPHGATSVALDGDRAIVGDVGEEAAYVFTRSGGVWTQQARLAVSSDISYDEFGIAVSLDGSTALVGAFLDQNDEDNNTGAVYAFYAADPSTPVSTVISPTTGGSLIYTDTQGLTTSVDVPPDAVAEATTLTYAPLGSPTAPISPALGLAGHAFTLDALRDGTLQLGFSFSKPVTITIYYADADVNKVNEQTLTLDYWDGSRWVDAATTCTPVAAYERHPAENWLAVPICHLSEFALLGQRMNRIYLPLIVRNQARGEKR